MSDLDPFLVVAQFERAIADYCGAPYAVSTTSCTMGLLLACSWFKAQGWEGPIRLPKRTYVGVAMSVKHAGFNIDFQDLDWQGEYQLAPLPLYDSARRLRRNMYIPNVMQVLSLHWSKILGVSQGGVILLDDRRAVDWLRRARFDGRRENVAPKNDVFDLLGYHAYMAPETAAAALVRLSLLPDNPPDLANSEYSDLSAAPVFR
jgi:dTDP-4-amino-4,6-dideoxygalactose transaminase